MNNYKMKDNKETTTVWSRIESKVDKLINTYTSVTEAQAILSQNQEVILTKLTEMSAKLDKFLATFNNDRKSDKITPNVIDSEENLNKFEQALRDYSFEQEMTKTYSVVCGIGKGRAINNAYALVDAMFDRNFLNKCSWAGGSRSDESKICFKGYKRVVNFFFKLIYQSDRQFTMIECEGFFKNILRNAKRRCEAKYMRASSQKRRMNRREYEQRLVENKIGEALVFLGEDAGPDNQESDDGSNEEQDWEINEDKELVTKN